MGAYVYSRLLEEQLHHLATETTVTSLSSKIPTPIDGRLPVQVDPTVVASQTTLLGINNKLPSLMDGRLPVNVDHTVVVSSLTTISNHVNPRVYYQTLFRHSSLSSTPIVVKSSPALLYGYNFVNTGSLPAVVKFFNHASPTVGTTVPLTARYLPPNSTVVIESPTVKNSAPSPP